MTTPIMKTPAPRSGAEVTPFRTPKSVGKIKPQPQQPPEDDRILGETCPVELTSIPGTSMLILRYLL